MALGIVAVALNNHSEVCHNVAVAPVCFAYRRLHFCYVEDLVDEFEQGFTLTIDRLGFVADVSRLGGLQVLTQPEYHGKRRAEFVGYIGEELLAHG